MTALSILGSLNRALGELDRVAAWRRMFGVAELPFNIPVEIEAEVRLHI